MTVNYTRTTDKDFCSGTFDVNEDLQNRIAIAKQFNPDVFCSLHNNSFNKSAKGIECHCYKFGGGDQKLAQRVQNQLSSLNFINRGTKASNFYVLRKFDGTNTDACLVEYGFIDSEEDAILANMDKASILIATGLLEHLGITYKEGVVLKVADTTKETKVDKDIYLSVRVLESKSEELTKKIIAMGYATKRLELA